MERIEVPATVYWQAKTGKRFNNKEDCEKYERLYDKWWNTRRAFEGTEGEECFAYWTETKEDLEEILWFAHYAHHADTHNYIRIGATYKPTWIVLYPDYDEYGVETSVRSIEDFQEIVADTLKAAQDTMSEIVKLIEEKQNV
jgi:hypothetical protein